MIDGGRVFQQQAFDLDKYLYDVKGYTDAEVQQLERDGTLVSLLTNKKIATGKVIPEDAKTGWYVLYNIRLYIWNNTIILKQFIACLLATEIKIIFESGYLFGLNEAINVALINVNFMIIFHVIFAWFWGQITLTRSHSGNEGSAKELVWSHAKLAWKQK